MLGKIVRDPRRAPRGRTNVLFLASLLAALACAPGLRAATPSPPPRGTPCEPPVAWIAPDGDARRFGESVAADGGFVAIGSPTAGDHGNEPGEVRVFRIEADGSGGLVAHARARIAGWRAGDRFGGSLAIRRLPQGLLLAVGADGADSVELFRAGEDGRGWTHAATLAPLHADPGADFGGAIAIAPDGRAVLVGARRADGGGALDRGAAYLFELQAQDEAWKQVACLTSPSPRMSGWFGSAVACTADLIAVGAPGEDAGGEPGAGAVHLFGRASGSALVAVGSLHSPRPLPASWFGSAIALDSSRIVVGEPRARASGVRAGAVWSWTRGGTPLDASRFEPPHAADGLGFGMTLALGGDWLVVGAPGHDGTDAAAPVEDCGMAVAYPLAEGASPRMLGARAPLESSLLGASVAIHGDGHGSWALAGHLYVEEESVRPSPGVAVFALTPRWEAAAETDPPDTSDRASASSPRRSRRR